jgi:hypothetical protein
MSGRSKGTTKCQNLRRDSWRWCITRPTRISPLVSDRHAIVFADSSMPSAVIRLTTLTAVSAFVF